MLQLKLKFRDGIGQNRPWLKPMVEKVQKVLQHDGSSMVIDGKFGRGTLKALKAFQKKHQLPESGVVGKQSWQAMAPELQILYGQAQALIAKLLPGFRGDLYWVHAQEGHAGRAYWPGGVSGVTLDPGADFGHADPHMLEAVYRDLLGEPSWQAMSQVLGLQGEPAKRGLQASVAIKAIRIKSMTAFDIMPHMAKSYWLGIHKRFPRLKDASTPASVQTSMLSIAYNRGPNNRHLEAIRSLIAEGDWRGLAYKISRMQQQHKLPGIRKRRRLEANLIRTELEDLQL